MKFARLAAAVFVVTIVLAACDSGDGDDANGSVDDGSRVTLPEELNPGEPPPDGAQPDECPLLPTEEVEDVLGQPMERSLALDTLCEWLAVDDRAVSATVAEITESEFDNGDGARVPGLGDDAYAAGLGLRVRSGSAYYEVAVLDVEGNSGLDPDRAARALARALLANV